MKKKRTLFRKYIAKVKPGKKIVIIGATSGIGKELAELYVSKGCIVGVTGRREEILRSMAEENPGQIHYRVMDVHKSDCVDILADLLKEMDGMDVLVYSAGIGNQNPELDPGIEMDIVYTNVDGFVRILVHAFNYFKDSALGQIVTISSLAGIRSLRQSPAYSATKRFQIHYTSCLAQKSNKAGYPIYFTTIVPGFIRTPMLKHKYPFTTSLENGARLIFNTIENKRRYTTVPGRWRWIEIIWRLIPTYVWERF